MRIVWIRWLDACSREAIDSPADAKPELAELMTVGFLLAEDDKAVLVGMEVGAHDVHPGRWRFTIPKSAILERREFPLDKKPTKRKSRAA